MLNIKANLKVAKFKNISSIVESELEQADIVMFNQYLPYGIYCPTKMLWLGPTEGCIKPEDYFISKRVRKDIRHSIAYFKEQGYRFEVVKMDEALFKEFFNLYGKTTSQLSRAVKYDLEGVLLSKIRGGLNVYLAGLWKDGELESGLSFYTMYDRIYVAFGAKKRFNSVRGGVGGLLEYLLIEFALKNNIGTIQHGRGVNPVGVYNKIGLFEFKARYGNSAYPSDEWVTMFIKSEKVFLSDLVFVTILDNKLGHLILSDKLSLEESKKRFTTKYINNIDVRPRNVVNSHYTELLNNIN